MADTSQLPTDNLLFYYFHISSHECVSKFMHTQSVYTCNGYIAVMIEKSLITPHFILNGQETHNTCGWMYRNASMNEFKLNKIRIWSKSNTTAHTHTSVRMRVRLEIAFVYASFVFISLFCFVPFLFAIW